MSKNTAKMLLLLVATSLLLTGCASQSEVRDLRLDVNALQDQMKSASSNAAQALQTVNQVKADAAAARKAAEQASADAAATKKMLQRIDQRIEDGLGQQSFK